MKAGGTALSTVAGSEHGGELKLCPVAFMRAGTPSDFWVKQVEAWVGDGLGVSCLHTHTAEAPWSSWCTGGREISRLQMQEIQDFEVEQTQQSSCGATRGVAEVVWCGGCPRQAKDRRRDRRSPRYSLGGGRSTGQLGRELVN